MWLISISSNFLRSFCILVASSLHSQIYAHRLLTYMLLWSLLSIGSKIKEHWCKWRIAGGRIWRMTLPGCVHVHTGSSNYLLSTRILQPWLVRMAKKWANGKIHSRTGWRHSDKLYSMARKQDCEYIGQGFVKKVRSSDVHEQWPGKLVLSLSNMQPMLTVLHFPSITPILFTQPRHRRIIAQRQHIVIIGPPPMMGDVDDGKNLFSISMGVFWTRFISQSCRCQSPFFAHCYQYSPCSRTRLSKSLFACWCVKLISSFS